MNRKVLAIILVIIASTLILGRTLNILEKFQGTQENIETEEVQPLEEEEGENIDEEDIKSTEIPLSVEEIENILTIHIIDETDEEAKTVDEAPPGGAVSWPPVNITKVSMGTYEGYLYVKFEFLGEIPVEKEEPIEMISLTVEIDADLNYDTGWHGTDIVIAVHLKYDAETRIVEPEDLDVTISYNLPTTFDEDEALSNADVIYGEYKGGPGTNYFIFRVPMDIVGLHSGQQIYFSAGAEASSPEYHHYARDGLRSPKLSVPGSDGGLFLLTIP